MCNTNQWLLRCNHVIIGLEACVDSPAPGVKCTDTVEKSYAWKPTGPNTGFPACDQKICLYEDRGGRYKCCCCGKMDNPMAKCVCGHVCCRACVFD